MFRFIVCFYLFGAIAFAQNTPQMVVKPIEPLPVGSPIDIEVGLFGNNDRPLENNVIEVYLNDEYVRRSRTDVNGTSTIRVGRDLPIGNYEIKVRFIGTRDYVATESLLPITIRPIYLTIQTVPPLKGIQFSLAEQKLSSDSQGLLRFEVITPGTYDLRALIEPDTLINPETKVTFARWEDEFFVPERKVEITKKDLHIQIGFTLSHPIRTHFIDLSDQPIDWSRVSSITLKSSSAAYRTINQDQPYWLQANRILRQETGIFRTDILWSVESVILDGSNVVNRYQQRFLVKPNDNWEIQLLIYQARITSKDTIFGRHIGSGVNLTYPDGSIENYSFDNNGEIYIFDMARGQYKMQVDGASGVAPLTPVALTKDQDVELKVLSSLDIATLMALGIITALGLLFYGRPHLLFFKKPVSQGIASLPDVTPLKALPPFNEPKDVLHAIYINKKVAHGLYQVRLLKAVSTVHLNAITPALSKRLRISPEKIAAQLSFPVGFITKPVTFEKALMLSTILKEYGLKTQVVAVRSASTVLYHDPILANSVTNTIDHDLRPELMEKLRTPTGN